MRPALKDFGKFPEAVQDEVITALQFAAHGEKADSAKPMKGLDSGPCAITETQGRLCGADG